MTIEENERKLEEITKEAVEKEKLCEHCKKRKHTCEYEGFFEAFDFGRRNVCKNCFKELSENNFKLWQKTQNLWQQIFVYHASINDLNLALIKQAVIAALFEFQATMTRSNSGNKNQISN